MSKLIHQVGSQWAKMEQLPATNIESKFEFKLNNNLDFMLWNKETLEIEKIFIS